MYINLKELTPWMLFTKLQGNLLTDSGEDDLLRIFTIYGHDDHLGHFYTFFLLLPGGCI